MLTAHVAICLTSVAPCGDASALAVPLGPALAERAATLAASG
jgi:hypothetical protein